MNGAFFDVQITFSRMWKLSSFFLPSPGSLAFGSWRCALWGEGWVGWPPAVNAESIKILLMLLDSQGFFCCVRVNVTHLRRGPWWDWEGYKKAEITGSDERLQRSDGLEIMNDWRRRKKLSFCQAREGERGYRLQSPVETQELRFPISAEHCKLLRTIS